MISTWTMSWSWVVITCGTPDEINKYHKNGLYNMKMHGQCFLQQSKLTSVNTEGRHKWFHLAQLQLETESLICAEHEQALDINVTKENMWNQGVSSMCRLYQKYDETIMHKASGCEILCGTKCLYRHDKIGIYLHWLILQDNWFIVCESWLHHHHSRQLRKLQYLQPKWWSLIWPILWSGMPNNK